MSASPLTLFTPQHGPHNTPRPGVVSATRVMTGGAAASALSLCVAAVMLVTPTGANACAHCPALMPIPAGAFIMGSPADEPERESWQAGTESPAHAVSFPDAFEIAATAVTVQAFRQFVHATGHRAEAGCALFDGTDWTQEPAASWQAPGFAQADDHPAVCVSWHDAVAYIAWLNTQIAPGAKRYRLPTEAEREYATRAGTTTAFWWGRSITPQDANYDNRDTYAGTGQLAPYLGRTVSVRSFAANPWGLYGVHGGVWEWTADCYVASYADKPNALRTAGSNAWVDTGCDRRVLRGGAFNRHPRTLRAAYRTGLDPSFRGHSIGLRVAR